MVKNSGSSECRYRYERPRPAMVPGMGDASPGLAGGVQRTGTPSPPAKGAVHSAEIEYAMGNLATNKVYAWTEADYKVSKTMQAYFVNFIKTGDPNGKGLPRWQAANRSNNVSVKHINVHSERKPEKHRERYLFLERAAKNEKP